MLILNPVCVCVCVCVCVSQDPVQFTCGGNPYLVFIRVELVLTSSQGW